VSDVFQGPGWWMASDGKWYAPERHPDEKYRKQFLTPPEAQSSAFPSVGMDISDPGVDETRNSPFSEMVRSVTDDELTEEGQREEASATPSQPQLEETVEVSGEELRTELAEVDAQRIAIANAAARAAEAAETMGSPAAGDVAWLALPDDAKTADSGDDADVSAAVPPTTSGRWIQRQVESLPKSDAPDVTTDQETATTPLVEPASEPHVQRRGFSVASPAMDEPPERPVFEHAVPASVVEAPATQRVEGRTELELELGRDHRATGITVARQSPESPGLAAAPPISTSMALVHVPGAAAPFDQVTTFDRVIASLVFLAGVAMIVGSFLHWTTGSLEQTGWDRGDGILAVIAGVLGSAAAGPIFVGFRHIVPKLLAVIAGLAGVVAVGFVAIDVLVDEEPTGTNLGVGFGVVLFGAIAMIGAGLADRGQDLD
jgi:hypothetical protein